MQNTVLLLDANMTNLDKRSTVFVDSFSKEIYEQTYKYYTDKDINDTHLRVARDLAKVEDKDVQDYWTSRFLDVLENFQFVPGGRITSNAGTSLDGTTMINCFVSAPGGEYQDSMEGILRELRHQALILKSEGGYGFCADFIRPRGAFIHAIANESPGAVRMLDMWDTQSAVITSGSGKKKQNQKGKNKIRKGAQMVTMSCWHPDIEEFITAKRTPNRLTKFNMSVLVTDEFMQAVKEGDSWSLEFPDYEHPEARSIYNEIWDGNIEAWKERGLPTKVYKRFDDANALWDLIMESAYTRNEPGVLFVDTINRLNNLSYCEYINSCNPCGEQQLPTGGVCLLGSLNLTQFVDQENKTWDWQKLSEAIPVVVRFMDNVNDRTKVPLPIQEANLRDKRRVGLGVLGYGSALLMLKVRYGGKKAVRLTEELMSFIMNKAYQASALLAKEKGAFPLYDEEKYLAGEFIKNLSDETISLIQECGLRNSHLLSVQPTGNSSVFANNVSGGLEPVFLPSYIRTSVQPYPPDGLSLPDNIDWTNRMHDDPSQKRDEDVWHWTKEGDEDILITHLKGKVYKIDQNRGLTKESQVLDYGVRMLGSQWDPEKRWAATAMDLSIDDHIQTLKVFAKYLDSAASKTVNLPQDYPYEDFKRLYMAIHKTGVIKGCTTYREGTMTAVLSAKSTKRESIARHDSSVRPESLKCDIHHLTYKGDKWIAIVGLYGEDPYEVFAFRQNGVILPKTTKTGTLTKRMVRNRGKYDLECDNGLVIKDVASHFDQDEEETVTRCISIALRHGVDIEYIMDQLLKSHGTVASFNKIITRALKKYLNGEFKAMKCLECGSKNIRMQESCFMCTDCGISKCQ